MNAPHCIVDIGDMVRALSKNGDKLPNVVFETWITKHYTKGWGVPCISTSMLEMDYGKYREFAQDRERIIEAAKEQNIDPLRYLPSPEEIECSDGGIWLFVKGSYLLMGDGCVIKKLWGDMCAGSQRGHHNHP